MSIHTDRRLHLYIESQSLVVHRQVGICRSRIRKNFNEQSALVFSNNQTVFDLKMNLNSLHNINSSVVSILRYKNQQLNKKDLVIYTQLMSLGKNILI